MSSNLLRDAGEARIIPGFSKYAACDDGRIWRIAPVNSTRYKNRELPYEITQTLGDTGYWSAFIEDDVGTRRKVKTHRLVTAAFHGAPPDEKSVSAHIDGDRQNNRPKNLAWATQKENISHKLKHGTSARWRLKAREPMSSKLLRDCGEALYGPRWQSELVRDLNVADRTMRRWAAGTDEPPQGVALDLLRLCDKRARTLDELRGRLHGLALVHFGIWS